MYACETKTKDDWKTVKLEKKVPKSLKAGIFLQQMLYFESNLKHQTQFGITQVVSDDCRNALRALNVAAAALR